jgi:hypothetical protein
VSGDVATPDDGSPHAEAHSEEDGVHVRVEGGLASGVAIVPWSEAIRIARRIIELARARGDLT